MGPSTVKRILKSGRWRLKKEVRRRDVATELVLQRCCVADFLEGGRGHEPRNKDSSGSWKRKGSILF